MNLLAVRVFALLAAGALPTAAAAAQENRAVELRPDDVVRTVRD